MTRNLTANYLAAINAPENGVAYLLEFQISGGTIRISTFCFDIVYGGQTWNGIGGLVEFGAATETADKAAATLEVTISGLNDNVVSALVNQYYTNRIAQIYQLAVNLSTGAIVDSVLFWRGRMNGGWRLRDTRKGGDFKAGDLRLTGTTRSILADFDRTNGLQSSPGSHQAKYPGDTFFSSVAKQVGVQLVWKQP